MKPTMKSFRTRLLIGSIIFAGGLLAVFHMLTLALVRHSFSMRIDHALDRFRWR